nr:MAG TPA: hypothetical protein [Caudoviricetes sp.]
MRVYLHARESSATRGTPPGNPQALADLKINGNRPVLADFRRHLWKRPWRRISAVG